MSIAIKRLIAGGLLALAAALPLNALAGETLSRVVDFRVLKVGMSGSQPPMNTVNRDGALMGLDVDLPRALASAMRVQLEIKRMPFGELMTALEEDKDMLQDLITAAVNNALDKAREAAASRASSLLPPGMMPPGGIPGFG